VASPSRSKNDCCPLFSIHLPTQNSSNRNFEPLRYSSIISMEIQCLPNRSQTSPVTLLIERNQTVSLLWFDREKEILLDPENHHWFSDHRLSSNRMMPCRLRNCCAFRTGCFHHFPNRWLLTIRGQSFGWHQCRGLLRIDPERVKIQKANQGGMGKWWL